MMIRRCSGILLLFLLACSLPVVAQQGDKAGGPKLDTTVNDTIVVGAEEPVAKTHVDTTFAAAPESESTAAPADRSPSLRTLPDSTVRRWQRDPVFAYANDPAYWKTDPPKTNSFGLWLGRFLSSKGFRYTVLILLGALLLFAIVRIAMENNVSLFYRRRQGKNRGSGEEMDGLPPAEDLDERIQFFLNAGDRRQATRYLYLKTLHLLSDRGLIRWHAEATNHDYLRELKGTPTEPPFRFLTRAYEMVWYGEFVLSESSFRRLHTHFTDLYKTLGA